MKDFKVIIAGTRDFNDYEYAEPLIDKILSNKSQTHKILIVCGMARGADLIGKEYGENKNYEVLKYPADWDSFGKSAGYIRNKEMANNADALIVFWDGASKGTLNMINIAKEKGLKVVIINYLKGEIKT